MASAWQKHLAYDVPLNETLNDGETPNNPSFLNTETVDIKPVRIYLETQQMIGDQSSVISR
jgi:hypothetical protein